MRYICVKLFLALQISIGFSSAVAAQNLQIDWEVINRYRLIQDQKSEAKLFEIANLADYLQCVVDIRNTCDKAKYLHGKTAFENIAPNGNIGFKTMPITHYNALSGKYDKNYISKPSHWKIKFSIPNIDTKLKCNWYIDNRLASGTGHCDAFKPDALISAGQIVRVEVNDASGSTGTVTVVPTDILVVGMGDSYASGEGMPDVPAVTGVSPALWFDEKCHLSLLSAQSLTAARLAANNKHRSVTFVSRACSGARIIDVVDLPQTDPPHKRLGRVASLCYGGSQNTDCASGESRILPAQLTAIKNDLKHADKGEREPDLVLLSISGNDYGFADAIMDLLKTDVVTGEEKPFDLARPYVKKAKKAREKVWENYPIMTNILTSTHGFPEATFVITGYPNSLMRDGKNSSFCFADKDSKNEEYFQISEQKGFIGNLVDSVINRARLKGVQNEYIALHNDFLVPLTGTVIDNKFIKNNKDTVYGWREANVAASCALQDGNRDALKDPTMFRAKYESDSCKNFRDGKHGFENFDIEDKPNIKWRFSLARNETGKDLTQGISQMKDFVVNGFCLNDKYKGVQGRWFNVLGDALTSMSSTGDIFFGTATSAYTGTAHPNIYGQLFLAERAWVAIPQNFKFQNNKMRP